MGVSKNRCRVAKIEEAQRANIRIIDGGKQRGAVIDDCDRDIEGEASGGQGKRKIHMYRMEKKNVK